MSDWTPWDKAFCVDEFCAPCTGDCTMSRIRTFINDQGVLDVESQEDSCEVCWSGNFAFKNSINNSDFSANSCNYNNFNELDYGFDNSVTSERSRMVDLASNRASHSTHHSTDLSFGLLLLPLSMF